MVATPIAIVPEVELDWELNVEKLHPTMKYKGADVYYQLKSFGAGPNATNKTVAHGISGISKVLSYIASGENNPGQARIFGDDGVRSWVTTSNMYIDAA